MKKLIFLILTLTLSLTLTAQRPYQIVADSVLIYSGSVLGAGLRINTSTFIGKTGIKTNKIFIKNNSTDTALVIYDDGVGQGAIDFKNGYVGTLTPTTLTAQRVWILPNKTGTILLSSDTAAIAELMWSKTGNSSTDSATNYIGTTDAKPLTFATNGIVRGIINSGTGNVGIGTTTPFSILHIEGSDPIVTIKNTDGVGQGGRIEFKDNADSIQLTITGSYGSDNTIEGDGALILKTHASSAIHFDTYNNRRMTVAANGEIGIGTPTPDSLLTVESGIWGKRGFRLSGIPSGVGTKALRINPSTGIVTYADTTAGGGGSQTWQQTLTSGSTLTGNNTIDGGGYNFKMNNTGFFSGRYDGTSTVTLANGGIAFGRAVDGKLTSTGDGNLVTGYVQDNNAEVSATGVGSLAMGYANDGAKILNTSNGSFVGGMSFHGASLVKNTGDGSFVWAGLSSSTSGTDTVSNTGYESFVVGNGGAGGSRNLFNTGDRSFVFGSKYSNSESDIFSYGVGSQQFLIDGNTGNVGIGTSTPSTALHVIGAIKATDSVSFTGLLPMSASTDSVVVRDVNGKFGTTGSVVTINGTQTLTNKRWTARVGSTTSSATPTINTDNTDIYKLTAQSADITSFTTNLSGTPVDGDILEIQVTGTAARAITWGASFVSSTVALPTTTATTATLTIIFQYYTTSSYGNNKWICVNYY